MYDSQKIPRRYKENNSKSTQKEQNVVKTMTNNNRVNRNKKNKGGQHGPHIYE